MNLHNVSIHSLRLAYGKSPRDDKMIEKYLDASHKQSIQLLTEDGKPTWAIRK